MPRRTQVTTRGSGEARSQAEGPEMITTTIALDAETHRELRHLSIEERTSFRELIREAIAEYLARRKRAGGR